MSLDYFFSIFAGTFVLEDLALASAIALLAKGAVSLPVSFLACFLGISVGDLLLYAFGYFSGKFGFEQRFKSLRAVRARFATSERKNFLTYTIVLSRFIPGTRLPTYLAAGLLGYSFSSFFFITVLSVFVWVGLAFAAGQVLSSVLKEHWFICAVFFLLVLRIVKSLVPKLADPWDRKALLHSWRRWLHFEFWPATLFYLPIVPYYVFLSLRYRSILAPFFANPSIENSGLIGESKWDFLKHLDSGSSSTLKSLKISKQNDFEKARLLLEKENFSYPFILKPDVGQRGFGVRIIRDDFDLTEYLLLADFEMIAQELSLLSCEAGIFYIRKPWKGSGFIFSITDKKFPMLIGDGKTKLGNLILNDPRARIIADVYFARHSDKLSNILRAGEKFLLSECGNHCQGAIFLNGKFLKTPELEQAIHQIALTIPHFFFGRFDIRYRDQDALKNGRNFEIVEINGAGSEATHIWDAHTSITEAYRTLFAQWRHIFEIGLYVKARKIKAKVDLKKFVKECLKVMRRKDPLSVSS